MNADHSTAQASWGRNPHLTAFLRGFAILLFAAAASAGPVTEDPLERKTLDIARELRCAVCQNQPVSESNAELARDMRQIIREQLEAGRSREEIVQYFVDRYGDYVLLNPPARGPGLVLWLVPLAVFAVLAAAAFVYLRHRRREALPPAPALSAEDRARIARARAQEENA